MLKIIDENDLLKEIGGIDMSNLNNLFNIQNTEDENDLKNNTNNKNIDISDLVSKIGNIWTDKYYDNENLDDFLIDDNNKEENEQEEEQEKEQEEEQEENYNNLTKYLRLPLDEVSFELYLTNMNDYDSLKETIKSLTCKEMFDKQIEMYEKNGKIGNNDFNVPNIPGTQKWVGIDDNGEKCLFYKLNSNSETKHFKYKHFQQLEQILLELVNFIENS